LFRAGYAEYRAGRSEGGDTLGDASSPVERVQRTLRRTATNEIGGLESWVPVLATVGSAAPFIGLFGTVWGIMRAFNIIGMTGETSLGILGPYISEALIATAVGLFAAIPAVMAYNYFAVRIRRLASEMDQFSADLLNLMARHSGRGGSGSS